MRNRIMTTKKKHLNYVTLVAVVLCIILSVAFLSIYFEYTSMVANRDSQITAQNSQINNIKGNITSLQNQLESLNSQISNLQAELKSNSTALTSANNQIGNLTAEWNYWFALWAMS
jgi:peptidoglycan hydrolase CwlO-like protein